MSGYWDDPERNRRVLVGRTAAGGLEETWFRTGDRVERLEDGNLTVVARADLQVKVRGHRVELGEVESALLGLGEVEEAVAFTVPDGEGSSAIRAAVVVMPGAEPDPRHLLDRLGDVLPRPAVPAELTVLAALPRTPTGKVDRKALRALSEGGEAHGG
jgi:acyl-coenzyme A synthetase/AMP-(fatty) acid ligase